MGLICSIGPMCLMGPMCLIFVFPCLKGMMWFWDTPG